MMGLSAQRHTFSTGRCPLWVKRRNTLYEQMTSALAPTTDIQGLLRHVRFVPILLQKAKIEQPKKSRES